MCDADDARAAFAGDGHPDVAAGRTTANQCERLFLANCSCGGLVDGKLSYDEFLDYYRDVSAAVDEAEHFVAIVRGCWGVEDV